jgi:hypothetical protein
LELQIGFLTEWQIYAQKLEGDAWIGEKMDIGKIEKMSGESSCGKCLLGERWLIENRSTIRADVRTYAGDSKEGD